MSRRTLQIAPGFSLPIDAVTETFALLATRGAGKTYTSKVIIEEMLKAGLHVVVLDPMPAWWGLRSSADGKSPGYQIAIFGGEHGDLPLESSAGKFIADLVVNERLSCIIDVSEFSKTRRKEFVADFAERLYKRNREAMHLVLEEADLFAPQKPRAGEERMLGAIEDIVRRGRGRGIGTTLITQRSAVINKDVLELTANLIALRTTGPRDRAAIKGWLEAHGTTAEIKAILDTLPKLPTGEAWFYSPQFLGKLERIKVRRAETFDSSATPKPGQAKRRPKTVADVDLGALATQMQDTIERAQADDPKVLRRRIAELEKERSQQGPPERVLELEQELVKVREELVTLAREKTPAPERVEVPIFDASDAQQMHKVLAEARDYWADASGFIAQFVAQMAQQVDAAQELSKKGEQWGREVIKHAQSIGEITPEPLKVRDVMAGIASAAAEGKPRGDLGGPERRILRALAWWRAANNDAPSRLQLAMVAGYHPRTKSFTNALGSLRSAGLVDYPEPGYISATRWGQNAAEPVASPGTEQDLQAMIFAQVKPAQARILRVLVDIYPESISRENLAGRLEYHPRTKAYTNNLGALRTLGLIDYPQSGHVRATEAMFLRRAA